MPVNVAHFLASALRSNRSALAVREGGRSLSYRDVGALAGGYAGALRQAGVRRGTRVAILLERGANAAAALFATYAAGGMAVFVNDRLKPRQVEHVLRDADADVLFVTGDALARMGRGLTTRATTIIADHPFPAQPFEPGHSTGEDAAQIIYTSGSTGLPKGVVFTHGAIIAGVEATAGYLGLRSSDRIASLLPFSAVYGLNQLLCTIASGAVLVVDTSVLAADICATLRRESVTVAATIPPLWLQLLDIPDFLTPLPSLRQMQNAGGHLPISAVRRLRSAQPQAELFLQYGMTETWRSAFLSPEYTDTRPGSMGRALPGAEILVVRDDGTLCDPGEPGELVYTGPMIGAGYWRRDDASAEVFRPHPLRPNERAVFSGDLVRRDEDGFLDYVARRDRVIKTLGYRIGPDEITDVLHASGQILEVVVTGEPDAERGQRIVAWVVLKPGADLKSLTRYCRAELPAYMQPSRYETRDHLPRLSSGKYDIEALSSSVSG